MKRIVFLILLFLSSGLDFQARGNNLKAYFTYCTFFSPENGPYLETYLTIMGKSLVYTKTPQGKYRGKILVTMLFKQGEQIIKFKKYNLLSPELNDTIADFKNFIDQQRIPLKAGKYIFEIELKDQHSGKPAFKSTQSIELDYDAEKPGMSDIELVESFKKTAQPGILSKSGYDIVPYVSDYFPPSMKKITFYAEVYNTDKALGENEKYLLNFFIQSFESGAIIGHYRGFERQQAAPANAIFKSFNIEELPSGNYQIVLEIRDKNNKLMVDKKLFFQRNNPSASITEEKRLANLSLEHTFVADIDNPDTLTEYIQSLRPISTMSEISFIDDKLSTADLDMKQKFFLHFWETRHSMHPEEAWKKYQHKVREVNRFYKTQIRKGYETDRGRIYLRYGPPNTISSRENEPSSYPYEIWHYYTTNDGQSDVKFVFYNPDLVTNDFVLLHSTAIGEIKDYRWQLRLQMRNTPENNLDVGKGQDHWGSEAEDLFNHPR